MRTALLVSLTILVSALPTSRMLASVLPLSQNNQWIYEFTDQSPCEQPCLSTVNTIMAELSELEKLGDVCMRPLTFGEEQLSLFLRHENEVLVLHGFRGVINQKQVEFFFHSGEYPSVFSGIPLAGMKDDYLLEAQKGKQVRLINEQKIALEWEVRAKTINRSELADSYTGEVASVVSHVNTGELYSIKFFIYIGPCEIEGGCNAGIFTFTFLPDIGLTEVRLQGDHPEFGGGYDLVYKLLIEPDESFELESSENLIDYTSCQTEEVDALKRSSIGKIANWFNILLLVVVVLRGFNRLSCTFLRV